MPRRCLALLVLSAALIHCADGNVSYKFVEFSYKETTKNVSGLYFLFFKVRERTQNPVNISVSIAGNGLQGIRIRLRTDTCMYHENGYGEDSLRSRVHLPVLSPGTVRT